MKLIASVLISLLLIVSSTSQAQTGISGRWAWKGEAGWQRLVFDFNAQGNRLTGRISMGPSSNPASDIKSSADFWEFFFDPVVFQISNGKINGNTITFEQQITEAPKLTGGGIPMTVTMQGLSSGKFVYTGTLSGDRIQFTREFSAAREDVSALGKHKIEFAVQRVK